MDYQSDYKKFEDLKTTFKSKKITEWVLKEKFDFEVSSLKNFNFNL